MPRPAPLTTTHYGSSDGALHTCLDGDQAVICVSDEDNGVARHEAARVTVADAALRRALRRAMRANDRGGHQAPLRLIARTLPQGCPVTVPQDGCTVVREARLPSGVVVSASVEPEPENGWTRVNVSLGGVSLADSQMDDGDEYYHLLAKVVDWIRLHGHSAANLVLLAAYVDDGLPETLPEPVH